MVAPMVVLAGGLGTRLRALTDGLAPKAMVPVNGRPFIDYKLRGLARMGVERVVLLVGERGEQIVEHVGDGHSVGLDVSYVHDGPVLLGTAGAIRNAIEQLPEHFWITYGDTFVTAELAAAEEHAAAVGADGLICVLRNEDRWEPSNIAVSDEWISAYRKGAPAGTFLWIDYGLLYLDRSSFASLPENEHVDLFSVVERLISRRALAAWKVNERFWDVGTPEAVTTTGRYFEAVHLWEQLK
jgi:MurNAc alpha-1-phosphate uridylyltransferase